VEGEESLVVVPQVVGVLYCRGIPKQASGKALSSFPKGGVAVTTEAMEGYCCKSLKILRQQDFWRFAIIMFL
jgi:hypothetical protein